ncbi:Ca-activated chloride channel family protein [Thermomonospora echinospora]|uniref:Ca-activated chloride channel family protein n=1 Tax=Thermomonospora echinospora TaxID=1992 RepID=A0A1H6ATZ1_9ACTN|nr:substrate-binding and VWA domain-containing protein [Thermomonospora echinospora]SEG52098.1 Ca-activated chloride channel family protein [Thermomonospora echinospora]
MRRAARGPVALAATAALAATTAVACGGGGDCAGTVRLRMAASQDKVGLLQRAADRFSEDRKIGGKCVEVEVDSKNSGTAMLALARGWDESTDGKRPDIWSPAANVWAAMLRLRMAGQDRTSPVPEGEFPPIMTSPLTIAMPRPMAEAIGWPDKAIGWADLADLATGTDSWKRHGHPEWGAFRLGKTNPNLSTSGLHATVGAYFAATGTTSDLTEADITSADNRKFVADIEKAIVHYGHTSLTFLTNLQRADDRGQALSYISAVTVEEDSVWNYNQGNPGLDPAQLGKHPKPKVPLAAIYPKEGTIYSDHPFVPLSWMDAEKKRAADEFLKFLHTDQVQKEFTDHGFRDHRGRPGRHVTRDNGLLPGEPRTTLSLPSDDVLDLTLKTWAELRKPANVLLVIDRSGSMEQGVPGTGKSKGDLAKEAAAEALAEFRGQDKVGLWMFSAKLQGERDWQELVPVGPMDQAHRSTLRGRLLGLTLGGGTGLYNTTAEAHAKMTAAREGGSINAVVVMTDGKNERPGGIDLETLIGRLGAGQEERVRVFTIGYGKDADQDVLRRIAEATEGASYDSSDPNTIGDIFTEVISNF